MLTDKIYEIGHRWMMSDMWLETVAAQDLMKFHIEERNRKEQRPIFVNELPYDNSENAKKNRIEALEPLFKNNQVWNHASQAEFEREYDNYPASATVDVLDTLGYVPQTLSGVRSKESFDFIMQQHESFVGRQVGAGGY
jgi:predicted MPP superfamily phosphohydrolase